MLEGGGLVFDDADHGADGKGGWGSDCECFLEGRARIIRVCVVEDCAKRIIGDRRMKPASVFFRHPGTGDYNNALMDRVASSNF